MFKPGDRLYAQDGSRVEFSFEHAGVGYVRPLLTTRIQVVGPSGDYYDEDEDVEPADHLIGIPLSQLYEHTPVAVIDAEIAAKRAVLAAEVKAHHADTTKRKAETKALESALKFHKEELEKWRAKYGIVDDAIRLLEGLPMYPLTARQGADVLPVIPKTAETKYLQLRKQQPFEPKKKQNGESLKWTRAYTSRYGETSVEDVLFFHTEEERDVHIVDRFYKVCGLWREKPNHTLTSYGNTVTYGKLLDWLREFPFLEMPADIIAVQQDHEYVEREEKKRRLQEQLSKLES